MESSLLGLLARLTLAGSVAIVLVLLLRRPVRDQFGARLAYHLWAIVPLMLAAAAFPPMNVAQVSMLASMPALPMAGESLALQAGTGGNWPGWLLAAWAAGAALSGLQMAVSHQRFVRRLGALAQEGGMHVAERAGEGPALLGLWRPKIIVPADFAARYTSEEQALIVAHEARHAQRGDPLANALVALLQCAFWFNPLAHAAAPRCRFDQELACDADVMQRHPGQAKAYASAMLKTQSGGAPAPATCHWQSSHPLKERMMNLKQTASSTPRRRAGRMIVALLACASVLATVAVRADTAAGAGADTYDLKVSFAEGAESATSGLRVKAGDDITMTWSQAPVQWTGAFRVTAATPGSVYVKMKITQKSGQVSAPTLLLTLGQDGAVAVDPANGHPGFRIGLVVTRAAPPVRGA